MEVSICNVSKNVSSADVAFRNVSIRTNAYTKSLPIAIALLSKVSTDEMSGHYLESRACTSWLSSGRVESLEKELPEIAGPSNSLGTAEAFTTWLTTSDNHRPVICSWMAKSGRWASGNLMNQMSWVQFELPPLGPFYSNVFDDETNESH